mmetsp:Transcript_143278/g.249905  ORF Transcript_143278/g.249905 Transcript_143278/m.249905 type:complete len:203 (+) Transcript_143278:227-835(+)
MLVVQYTIVPPGFSRLPAHLRRLKASSPSFLFGEARGRSSRILSKGPSLDSGSGGWVSASDCVSTTEPLAEPPFFSNSAGRKVLSTSSRIPARCLLGSLHTKRVPAWLAAGSKSCEARTKALEPGPAHKSSTLSPALTSISFTTWTGASLRNQHGSIWNSVSVLALVAFSGFGKGPSSVSANVAAVLKSASSGSEGSSAVVW